MAGKGFFSEQTVTAWLLILSGLVFMVAGMLFTGRAIWKWPSAAGPVYLRWERGFVAAAALIALLGFTLLERQLEAAGDRILAPSGWVILVIATASVVVVEAYFASRKEWLFAPFVFVALTFLGQAVLGAALLRTGHLPGWVGWATILWNLGWLVVLPVFHPQDMYYPWLHHVAPLLIGIVLLMKGSGLR